MRPEDPRLPARLFSECKLGLAMYIHELTVRNYMIHRSSNIKLSPITVLIGPNGGGKSALFDAILNFSMLSRGSIKQAFGGYPYSYSATKCRRAAGYERIGF